MSGAIAILQPSRIKIQWPSENGDKVRYLQLTALPGYPWGIVQVLNEAGEVLKEQPIRIKPTDNGLLEMQLAASGQPGDPDLVLDDNGLWTSGS